MRKFVSGLGKPMKKECKTSLLISNIDISRLMLYTQQIEDDKRKDKEGHLSKKENSARHENNQRQSKGNRYDQQRKCPTLGNKAQSSTITPPTRGNHRGTTSGTGGGTNRLYAMGHRQDQENSPDVVHV
ncbi:uncharacterized protein LOC129892739 [Solanum dulcamara]|uniref:uncharacterized protein LOC129892739 n=1 Tax=Solanum dulcamara TaxID=45834 RepID=UPI0024867B04|nr:uncharacterized protein LOC129892739 [Solanum dulcamara]